MGEENPDFDLDLTIWLLAPDVTITRPGSLADAISEIAEQIRQQQANESDEA